MDTAPSSQPAIMLVHGWGSCFADTWEATGITSLLADENRESIGVDLLGHGSAPKPHDPDEYNDLGAQVREKLPNTPIDAVGFSLGAHVLLGELVKAPNRFRRVVLAGIGDGVFEQSDGEDTRRILAGLDGTAPESDVIARLFRQYADRRSNDIEALAAVLRRPRSKPFKESDLNRITNPVLVAIGDGDFSLPADRLAKAFPNGTLHILINTDHFKTPESFQFIDTMLKFLDEQSR
ncbi:MAG: alpha/beta fold hydrolase [Ilumatobacteraceae bacterium]